MNKWTKEKSESKKDFPIDIFFQRRYADDQQRNADQNHSEISSHSH